MDIAATGALMIFFSLLVGFILVGLLVGSYAAYSFLLTLTSTAAGNDEVYWPGEPIQDWLFKVWYLGWLLAFWAVPACLVLGLLPLPRPLLVLGVGVLLWLLFPVGLLSSLSAQSQFIVLRPAIVRSLLLHFGTTLGFYASSGVVVALCAGLSYVALLGAGRYVAFDQPVLMIPLAAMAWALGCLVYARLLGRLAWVVSAAGVTPSKKRSAGNAKTVDRHAPSAKPRSKQMEARKLPPSKKKGQSPRAGGAYDPWAVPSEPSLPQRPPATPATAPADEDPLGPAQGSYAVQPETAVPPPAKVAGKDPFLDEELEPYTVSAAPASELRKALPVDVPEVLQREEELASPRRVPPPPDHPLVTGVYGFPFYPRTQGPWATLAVGFVGVLGLLRLLLYAAPF